MCSINQAVNVMSPSSNGVAMAKVLSGILADLTALTAAVNQLITDYNAKTEATTATSVSLTTTQ